MALHKHGSMSVFLQKRRWKYAWESSALSTWEEKLSHSLLRFLILDADEWKFLNNFSNIPKEPWKMAWRDIFQEELLERACEAVTCSSEGMPCWAAMDHGPLLLLPLSCCWTTAAATAASGMPTAMEGTSGMPAWGWTRRAFASTLWQQRLVLSLQGLRCRPWM